MKNFMPFILCLFSFSSFALAHGGGESRVSIEPESQSAYRAGKIQYSFQLFDDQSNKVVGEKDLVISNTKLLHFVAYDESLHEFNHVHPTFDGKIWTVELNLPVNGNYFLWAQGTLLDQTEFSSSIRAQVMGGSAALPVLALGDHRIGEDHNTVLTLSKQDIHAGQLTMLDFIVSRNDGQEPILSPYLGALAHLIAVSPDGDELIHVHPMAGSTPNSGMIHANFPGEGDYRIWIQLVDHGVLKTIPLSVSVLK